jgi:t-SNARE complex subunit (syntaxin)
MKTTAFIISISLLLFFSVAQSQTLKNPKLIFEYNDYEVSGGNFLIVNSSKEIKTSTVTYDEIKKLEEKTNSLSALLDNLISRTISEQKKTIDNMNKIIDNMKRTVDNMNRDIDKLEKIIEQQNRKISDLERKIK